jgi:hypothetical protein
VKTYFYSHGSSQPFLGGVLLHGRALGGSCGVFGWDIPLTSGQCHGLLQSHRSRIINLDVRRIISFHNKHIFTTLLLAHLEPYHAFRVRT